MKLENFNVTEGRRRVLIAPLDWGLGHATRCIPVIYSFIAQNFDVIIAADGAIKNLLETEFPDVVFTHLKGYKIRYSHKSDWLPLKLFAQLPGLLRSIYAEHRWLKEIIRAYKIDLVISDNRLGLHDKKTTCIYITHQLNILTGNRFTEWLLQRIHYYFINKYTGCWVPDLATKDNLAGDLSHPKNLPAVPVKYLGPLSRFEKITIEKKYDLLVLISGPEPQRTIFETLMLKELKNFSGTVLLVKGLPGNAANVDAIETGKCVLSVVNHLSATALNKAIQQSALVICRSGYTTIMDLVKIGQKAILVPTPGQTEQEYLATYLSEKKLFFTVAQNNLSLANALQQAASFPFIHTGYNADEYKKIICDFINHAYS